MKGKVYLIGCGPGDYKLITLKGKEIINNADVIVYDRLISTKLLEDAKENCEFIYVGKESKNHTKTQDQINEIIYQHAINGKIVARLKGGDPYVFGRGGEEGQYLIQRGIEIEVIPGITSAIGGLAYAGIPITHRDFASSFHVITGHLKDEGEELKWEVLAKLNGTLVFLMGMSELKNITSNLMENGMDVNTPVGIVHWAATEKQQVVTGDLMSICNIVKQNGIKNPSIIVIGHVVNLRNELNFHENKPLFGKSILVTRARQQASILSDSIYNLGGNPIEFPTIKIEDISTEEYICQEIKNISKFTYLIFTSQNGVEIFMKRLFSLGMDSRQLKDIKIVAIGKVTAKALKKFYLRADIIPLEYVAEGIYKELKNLIKKEDKILIPRAEEARDYLVDELSKICQVTELKIYRTVLGEGTGKHEDIEDLLVKGKIDYITFTSSSTVKNLCSILGEKKELLNGTKLISIGPITSKTIESLGFEVYNEAKVYDIEGLVNVLIEDKVN